MMPTKPIISRFLLLVFILSLMLFSLSSCSLDNIAAMQEKTSTYWPELLSGDSYGQTFVSTENGLDRIDLSTATFARINTSQVIFHLRSAPDASTDLRTITLPGDLIQNERPTSFEFEPIADSKQQSYYFYIESPDGEAGNAITVYANDEDTYKQGSAYQNGRMVPGDMVFTAYAQQQFSLAQVLNDFGHRWLNDISFLIVYLAIIAVVVFFLLKKKRNHNPVAVNGEEQNKE